MHSAKPFNTCQHWQQLHPIFDVSPPCLECLDNHRRKSLEWAVEKGIIHPSKSLVLIGWVQWKAWWDYSVRTDWLRRWTNETALVLSPGKHGMFGHRRGDGLCPANNLLPREKWNKICMLAPTCMCISRNPIWLFNMTYCTVKCISCPSLMALWAMVLNIKSNERKSEQAHIPYTPTLFENAANYAYHHNDYERWYWSIR